MSRRKHAEREAAQEMKRRRELLLERKERRERRTTMAILFPVLALVLAFIGFGFYREGIWRPRQPVARVSGEAVRADDYGKRVQFARRQMLSSLNSFAGLLQSSDPTLLTDIATRQRNGVSQDVLNEMIDDQIIMQEAERLGINVTNDDVKASIREDLAETLEGPALVESEDEASEDSTTEEGDAEDAGESSDTDSEASEDTEGDSGEADSEEGSEPEDGAADAEESDDAESDDAPSDAEIERAFERILQPQLDDAGMNRADYEELVRIRLYREKLNETLGEDIARTGTQVEADYLLFTDQSVAAKAEADLASGMKWDEAVVTYQRPEVEVVDDSESEPAEDAEGEAETDGDEDVGEEASDDESVAAEDEADGESDEATEEGEADEASTEDEEEAEATDSGEGDDSVEDEDAEDTADESADSDDEEADAEGDASEEDSEDASEESDEAADEGEADAEEGEEEDVSEEAPSPTPAPTATPEPYAYEIGESKWYTQESLEERLVIENLDAESVFGLKSGETSFAIEGNRGTYIIRVTDSAADREIDEAELQPELDGALDAWLEDQRVTLSSEIDRFPAEAFIPAEPSWFITGFNQIVGTLGSAPPITVPDTSGGMGTHDGG